MAGGDGIVGTITVVPPSPGAGDGTSGDTVTVVAGAGVVASVVVVVVVVGSLLESFPPHPVASEPAATPAASANSAEFGRTLRMFMPPVVTRRRDS